MAAYHAVMVACRAWTKGPEELYHQLWACNIGMALCTTGILTHRRALLHAHAAQVVERSAQRALRLRQHSASRQDSALLGASQHRPAQADRPTLLAERRAQLALYAGGKLVSSK